jgi:hypothetical protein
LVLIGLLAPTQGASGATCGIEAEPAATLLLPYFEQSLACTSSTSGISTLFSINNASANAVLAHVVVWSDLSVPVLGFNVYLTGYDVQSISMCDLLVTGHLPPTASVGQDPSDTISPKGTLSQDVNFSSCQGQLPPSNLPASFLTHLQTSLTGQFSALLGGCAGVNYGDNIARGYVTVDTVSNCTLRFPGDAGYFAADGTGDATDQNVLVGDYDYINPGVGLSQGYTMVHIQADPNDPETSASGQYTFYGRYVNWTAIDHRQPLATTFFARYQNGGSFNGATTMTAWRDSKVQQGAFKCGTAPAWYPLSQARIVTFDEQEHAVVPSPIFPFPAEAGRIGVGSANLPTPFTFGWILYDLNATAGTVPPEDPLAQQAWMTLSIDSHPGGIHVNVGYPAFQLDTARDRFRGCRTNIFFKPPQ